MAPSRELAMQILRVAQSLLPESAKRAVQQAIGAGARGGAGCGSGMVQKGGARRGSCMRSFFAGQQHTAVLRTLCTLLRPACLPACLRACVHARCCAHNSHTLLARACDWPARCALCTRCAGGANMLRQKEALKLYKPFMVVGTPGRIAELSRDGALQASCAGHCAMIP